MQAKRDEAARGTSLRDAILTPSADGEEGSAEHHPPQRRPLYETRIHMIKGASP